jgi:hypothetical protein
MRRQKKEKQNIYQSVEIRLFPVYIGNYCPICYQDLKEKNTLIGQSRESALSINNQAKLFF